MPKWNTVGILVAGTFMVFAQSALAAGDVENGKKVYTSSLIKSELALGL